MGRVKMATTGSRHVMESYREINDRRAVVPEAMMEIGHTHLLTTHARRGGCQGRERCVLHWVFLTSLSSQGKQVHAAWLLTDTWICAQGQAGCFSCSWWGRCTCTSQNTTTWIRRDPTPPNLAKSLLRRHWTVLEACAAYVPIIALSSLFKVYIRCLNMYINSCCVLLLMFPWDNYPFLWLQHAASSGFALPGFVFHRKHNICSQISPSPLSVRVFFFFSGEYAFLN